MASQWLVLQESASTCDVWHLSGLYSLGLTKYQVRIKLSDVMYFHVVENELIGVFDLSRLNGVFEK